MDDCLKIFASNPTGVKHSIGNCPLKWVQILGTHTHSESGVSLKIVYIGCVESSLVFLKKIISLKHITVAGIVTKEASKFNSDFVSLQATGEQHDIPVYNFDLKNNEDMNPWIAEKAPDLIFCFGWSHLLKQETLKIPRLGTLGYHPAKIPHNRGRHPIIWALALGLKQTASTFFLMDEQADQGRIVSQEDVKIEDSYYANDLYQALLKVGENQIEKFCSDLESSVKNSQSQDLESGNEWRKRGKQDGKIDFRMSARSVFNLVRALSKPYAGAHFELEGQDYKVWRANIVKEDHDNYEPGKIISHSPLVIKCGQDAINFTEYDLPEKIMNLEYL